MEAPAQPHIGRNSAAVHVPIHGAAADWESQPAQRLPNAARDSWLIPPNLEVTNGAPPRTDLTTMSQPAVIPSLYTPRGFANTDRSGGQYRISERFASTRCCWRVRKPKQMFFELPTPAKINDLRIRARWRNALVAWRILRANVVGFLYFGECVTARSLTQTPPTIYFCNTGSILAFFKPK